VTHTIGPDQIKPLILMAGLHWVYINNFFLSQTSLWILIEIITIRALALRARHYSAI